MAKSKRKPVAIAELVRQQMRKTPTLGPTAVYNVLAETYPQHVGPGNRGSVLVAVSMQRRRLLAEGLLPDASARRRPHRAVMLAPPTTPAAGEKHGDDRVAAAMPPQLTSSDPGPEDVSAGELRLAREFVHKMGGMYRTQFALAVLAGLQLPLTAESALPR